MEKKVLAYALDKQMLAQGDGVVVGVSGGADSMCLLTLLADWREQLGLKLLVLHVNHGIRKETAARDEEHVRSFCEKLGAEFECVHADVPALAAKSGRTEEEEGRYLRYAAFKDACRRKGYTKIAVAHNRDDNAETVLFNLFRGSGISGMRGITPKREEDGITVIRPLLATSRKEIEHFLKKRGIAYVHDETNDSDEYSRNRIRHTILPYAGKAINSSASEHIARLAAEAGELEQLVGEMTSGNIRELEEKDEIIYTDIAGALTEIKIDCGRLKEMNPYLRRSVIRRLIGRIAGSLKDIDSDHIEAVVKLLEKGVGRQADLPYNITAKRGYRHLIFGRRDAKQETEPVPEQVCSIPGEYTLEDGKTLIRLSVFEINKNAEVPKNDYTKWFDYDKIKNNVVIRTGRDGDYLLIGKKAGDKSSLGRKSLKSYYTDSKIPRELRDRILVLAEGSHILWIPGRRRDDSFPVTEKTVRVLCAQTVTDMPVGGHQS